MQYKEIYGDFFVLAKASDESDGVAKQVDEQIGIFQILDKLEEAEWMPC